MFDRQHYFLVQLGAFVSGLISMSATAAITIVFSVPGLLWIPIFFAIFVLLMFPAIKLVSYIAPRRYITNLKQLPENLPLRGTIVVEAQPFLFRLGYKNAQQAPIITYESGNLVFDFGNKMVMTVMPNGNHTNPELKNGFGFRLETPFGVTSMNY